jgi:hypothetical protein
MAEKIILAFTSALLATCTMSEIVIADKNREIRAKVNIRSADKGKKNSSQITIITIIPVMINIL